MYVIETKKLTKRYGHNLAVNNVNMHIEEGSIYGFVGENGSGKTTIMRLLTGLAEPTSGSYSLFGYDHKDNQIYAERKKMSAIVETTSLVPSMTARDNIIFQELYLGIRLTEEERNNLLKKVHLENVEKKKIKDFSLGMRQRMGIALSLINKPKLMLLDEPMNGLDPQGIVELRELLVELNQKEGLTILISSHILSELEKIATHYGFISHGKLLEELTVEELQQKSRKSLKLFVDDLNKAVEVMKELKIKEYAVSPSGEIKVYDDIDIASFVTSLHQNKIKVTSIKSKEESIEEY